MPIVKYTKSLYYDDVNLIAQPNDINSRLDIPRELWRVVVSPMEAIVNDKFSLIAINRGLTVAIPRFKGIDREINTFNYIKNNGGDTTRLWASIGLDDKSYIKDLIKVGYTCIIIDVANAGLQSVYDLYSYIKSNYNDVKIVVGNTHSVEVLSKYTDCIMRIGIGNGSACTTTTHATGYGRGQITELLECCECSKNKNIKIIADGGINKPCNAVKAFACGAEYIMMGGYFSIAEECEGVLNHNYRFWGSASSYNQEIYGSKRRHAEGKVIDTSHCEQKPLDILIDELWNGISSGISYGGFNSLTNFIGNGIFEIKHSRN